MTRLATLALTAALTLAPAHLGAVPASNDAARYLGTLVPKPVDPRAYVKARAARAGWHGREWRCLRTLIALESSWRLHAANPRSSARGLFQVLHQDPNMGLEAQTRIGLRYIAKRHHTPCKALAFHRAEGWY